MDPVLQRPVHSFVQKQWRKPAEDPHYTNQEVEFISWLTAQHISFKYEGIQLVKAEAKGKRPLIKVIDFVFSTLEDDVFGVEVTDRKRPHPDKERRTHDPKWETRHLSRLANFPCAIIYRDELAEFIKTFEEVKNTYAHLHEKVLLLRKTIDTWNRKEWFVPEHP